MSGPKSVRYQVDWAAVARAEALAQVRTDVQVLRADVMAFTREVTAARHELGESVPVDTTIDVDDIADPVELRSRLEAARRRLAAAQAELTRSVVRHGMRTAAASLSKGGQVRHARNALASAAPAPATSSTPTGCASPQAPPKAASEVIRERVSAGVERQLSRLLDGTPAPQLARVRAAAQRATTTGLAMHLDQLTLDVDAAVVAAADAERARDLIRSVTGLSHPGVDAARAELAQVVAGTLRPTPDAWRVWDERLTALRDSAERAHVHAALAEAFGSLGYAVGPEFTTSLGQGRALVTRPGWEEYALSIRPRSRRVDMSLVRGGSDGSQDEEREREFCDDLDLALADLAERGIDAQVDRARPPGTAPVAVVADVPVNASRPDEGARSERARAAARARQQGKAVR